MEAFFLIAFVFKPSCFLIVQMGMMQQWEPLVVVYIKEQMEPSEPIGDCCGDVWRKSVRDRGEADKQFVYFQHYHRHRFQTQTVQLP